MLMETHSKGLFDKVSEGDLDLKIYIQAILYIDLQNVIFISYFILFGGPALVSIMYACMPLHLIDAIVKQCFNQ